MPTCRLVLFRYHSGVKGSIASAPFCLSSSIWFPLLLHVTVLLYVFVFRSFIISSGNLAVKNGYTDLQSFVCEESDPLENLNIWFSTTPRTAPSNEIEANVETSLWQDQFLLGEHVNTVALSILCRCGDGPQSIQPARLGGSCDFSARCVEKLHQVEGADALPHSDEVAGFLQKVQRTQFHLMESKVQAVLTLKYKILILYYSSFFASLHSEASSNSYETSPGTTPRLSFFANVRRAWSSKLCLTADSTVSPWILGCWRNIAFSRLQRTAMSKSNIRVGWASKEAAVSILGVFVARICVSTSLPTRTVHSVPVQRSQNLDTVFVVGRFLCEW